jgi:hypothetical protein
MPLFCTSKFSDEVRDKDIFLDNDFLNCIFKYEELFEPTAILLNKSFRIIDPLVAFEFQQTVFIPEERKKRSDFLNSEFFYPAVNHQTVFLKIQENASILARIYKHQKANCSPSLVDLFLAGRLMYLKNRKPLLITGNKRDFPSCVFATLGVMAWERSSDGGVINYYLLEFDEKKFVQNSKALDHLLS